MGPISTLSQHARAFLLQSRQNAGPTTLAPPGVVPNYVDPHTISNQVIITSLTLIVFSGIFVAMRLVIKWRLVKHLTFDDCE